MIPAWREENPTSVASYLARLGFGINPCNMLRKEAESDAAARHKRGAADRAIIVAPSRSGEADL
jgi:hypothetical protein